MHQLRGIEVKRFNKSVKKQFKNKRQIVLVLFSVEYQANIGMIFRLCDALGVTKLYLTGGVDTPKGNLFETVSRHKLNKVDYEVIPSIESVLLKLKEDGYDRVAVEITESSMVYNEYQWKDKTALILGNEGHGVPDKILNLCDSAVYIPMLGAGGSLNVGVAASIVGYEVLSS
jgi:tRNA G18 (ribose-2'-O)-methylase SpoU